MSLKSRVAALEREAQPSRPAMTFSELRRRPELIEEIVYGSAPGSATARCFNETSAPAPSIPGPGADRAFLALRDGFAAR